MPDTTSTDKGRKLSLSPLTFQEAVTDLLKVSPAPKDKPKATKKKRARRRRGNAR